MSSHKIILATDFSESSRAAMSQLNQINGHWRANVWFMHVVTAFWKDWFTSGGVRRAGKSRLKFWLHDSVEKETIEEDRLLVERGNAAAEILIQAEAKQADFIFLGAKVPSKHRDYMLGSVAGDVIRHAKCPVWLASHDKVSRILCGIDGSDAAVKALSHAVSLARTLSVPLEVVQVLTKIDFQTLGMSEEDVAEEEIKYQQTVEQGTAEFLAQFDLSGIDMTVRHPWGAASQVLVEMANDLNCDLMVIGAVGRGMLSELLMGSTAEKILRSEIASSLLVVR